MTGSTVTLLGDEGMLSESVMDDGQVKRREM